MLQQHGSAHVISFRVYVTVSQTSSPVASESGLVKSDILQFRPLTHPGRSALQPWQSQMLVPQRQIKCDSASRTERVTIPEFLPHLIFEQSLMRSLTLH